ncbi:MAG: energy-coupling factor ABC transporter permease, partial [Methanopyri archaeon]|nr:energy-coupling factor ABC transporter permease [Methanopyri archaeon]
VFAVQCVLFQDGGLLALGANIVNMGLIGTILGYYIFRAVESVVGGRNGLLAGSAVAAWLAVVIASAATAVELAASGTSPLKIVLPAMVGVHAIIGIVEAAVTVAVIGFVTRARPDLLELERV